MLAALWAFFIWLANKPGYKSRIAYTDADYFNLTDKEVRAAKAKREKPVPTMEQVHRVLDCMPTGNDIELRNRALIAFALLTGARGAALATFKLKHVDLTEGCVFQDARDVKTKNSKTFTTWFCPVEGNALQIATEWCEHLRENLLWRDEDPLFSKTQMGLGEKGGLPINRIGPRALKRDGTDPQNLPGSVRGSWPALLQSALLPRYVGAAGGATLPQSRRVQGLVTEYRPSESADDVHQLRSSLGPTASRADPQPWRRR